MFSALLLVCSIDYDRCQSHVNTNVYQTREECIYALGEGYDFYESRGLTIVSYDCYKWNTTKLDQES